MTAGLGYVKPLVNGLDAFKAGLEGREAEALNAEIQCPECGYTWVGSNRTYYTCPKRNGCGYRWSIVKWRKIGDRFVSVEGKASV